ncbi:hypothetical protein EDD93_7793 [Streptomyces sp. 840.1]|nr:hypothetical protein EDD93_7793 [Streptomyces sp. 840.1]
MAIEPVTDIGEWGRVYLCRAPAPTGPARRGAKPPLLLVAAIEIGPTR